MTSSVLSAALGPMRSVQKVLLMKLGLGCLHNVAPADDGRNRVAVAERLAEDGEVRLHAV